MIPIELLTVI